MKVIVVTIQGDSGRDTRYRLLISNRMTENSNRIIVILQQFQSITLRIAIHLPRYTGRHYAGKPRCDRDYTFLLL